MICQYLPLSYAKPVATVFVTSKLDSCNSLFHNIAVKGHLYIHTLHIYILLQYRNISYNVVVSIDNLLGHRDVHKYWCFLQYVIVTQFNCQG